MRKFISLALATTALTLAGCATNPAGETATAAASQGATDPLLAGFVSPPNSARPRTWWHWMNGNITQDGIAKDLEWLDWVGVGGVQNFDANLETPQIVDQRLVYMDEDWQAAFRFANRRAQDLGMEFAIAASPGWSETGGPWVEPQDGMKKLAWSEITIDGGVPFSGRLPDPPHTTGPFQTLTAEGGLSALSMAAGQSDEVATPEAEGPEYYRDVRVLAFPAPAAVAVARPRISTAFPATVDAEALLDGSLDTVVSLARPASGEVQSLVYSYSEPQTVGTVSFYAPGAAVEFLGALVRPVLESSSDGETWQEIAELPLAEVPTTLSFVPVTATHFRVRLLPGSFGLASTGMGTEGVDGGMLGNIGSIVANIPITIADLRLSAEPVIDHFEAKAGFHVAPDYYALEVVEDGTVGVDPAQVLDLTDRLQADGTLDWTPPPGRWRVLRLGYSLTGTTNHPATPEATGLEVDKFDGAAVRRYMENYLALYSDALDTPVAQQDLLDAILVDSFEAGAANWTPDMIAQFTRLRGYDPTPWLPTLTGTIVRDRAASDAFLYDFRRTLADLLASEHYGTVAEVAHEHGLIVYGEALENGRPSLGDDLAMRSYADIPMSAMWTHTREAGPNYAHVADIRGAASVAHLRGTNLVAAESMTSAMQPWDSVPRDLKRIIDLEFVNGVNRPVIHTSVHQPLDSHQPGLTLMIFGQYFNRHESWAPLARPWIDYISRTAYMLQQGRNVADVLYFYGEDAPPAALYQQGYMTDAPAQYAWNFVYPDMLASGLSVDGGRIVTAGGASYRAIYLGGTSRMMTLPVLRGIAQLVRDGATVIGARPEATPSMADDAAEFERLATALWSGDTGHGQVLVSDDIDGTLARLGVAPAFRTQGAGDTAQIPFVEREWDGGRLFFLSNPGAESERFEARFRVSGMAPELWDAVTGESRPASYRSDGGETIVPLTLASDDSVFVVFREETSAASRTVPASEASLAATVSGPWTVSFEEGHRGPAPMALETLGRWDESGDEALRYYSGVATYANSFTAPAGWQPGQALWLDLGEVYDLAEVWVNGERVGGLWRAPWRIDLGEHARAGRNALEIRIANRWVNRLIGDVQEGAEGGSFNGGPGYRPDATLRPSGLLGPVTLSVE